MTIGTGNEHYNADPLPMAARGRSDTELEVALGGSVSRNFLVAVHDLHLPRRLLVKIRVVVTLEKSGGKR